MAATMRDDRYRLRDGSSCCTSLTRTITPRKQNYTQQEQEAKHDGTANNAGEGHDAFPEPRLLGGSLEELAVVEALGIAWQDVGVLPAREVFTGPRYVVRWGVATTITAAAVARITERLWRTAAVVVG